MLPVAILAGGMATRMGSLTSRIPKALLDVAGRPFLFHQLDLLRDAGVPRVVLCVAHLAEQIEEQVGDGAALGIEVRYSRDGDRLVGTGGALRRALPLLGEQFLVLYGDSYLRCDYRAIASSFQASGKRALMTVYRNDGRYDASNVSFENGRILRYDKTPGLAGMTHIDWGLGAFSADVFSSYASHERFDLALVYQDLVAKDHLLGYEVHERFYEIGSVAGLEETRQLLSSARKEPS